MADEALWVQYWTAHVKLYSEVDTSRWSVEDFENAIALLPTPKVPFEEWYKRKGMLTEKQQQQENAAFLDQIRALAASEGTKDIIKVG